MTQTKSSASGLQSTLSSLSRYSGLVFGVGYILLFAGIIAISVELIIKTLSYLPPGTIGMIPVEFIVVLILLLISVICGIALGASIANSSKSIQAQNLNIKNVSSSISAFSFMILFYGIALIILISKITYLYPSSYYSNQYLVAPICMIVGAILLLVGYRVYVGKASESRITGGIFMVVSVILIYFIAYWAMQGYFFNYIYGGYSYGLTVTSTSVPGSLTSDIRIESVALLLVAICALLYAFPYFRSKKGFGMLGIVLSTSAIIFACGLLFFNFSMFSTLSSYISVYSQIYGTIWIIYFGFLILGISGIMIIVSASVSLALLAKEVLATPSPRPLPPPPPPPPPSVV